VRSIPLSDETTDKNSLTTPAKASGFPAARKDPLLGGFIQFFTPPSRDPMVQTWHFEVQRELPANMMLSVGYVGNHGTHLAGEGFRQYNFVHTADRLKYRNELNATVPITNYFSGTAAEALTNIWVPKRSSPSC